MRCMIYLAGLLCIPLPAIGDDTIQIAEGLTIRLIADDEMVPDCTCMAIDHAGRIIASGPGYLRMLVDQDGDGRIDRSIELADRPSHGAHGIYPDGDTVYFVGDNGIWHIEDSDGDHVPDTAPTQVLAVKTGGEHDAHALRKGPDGFWYLIAGNNAESMFSLQNVLTSSIPYPRAGTIWRISPDWSQREVWAHGFRNAYDFDFAPDHAIDTFDSDGERDVSLPWYRPTRVFRVHRGDDAGWMTRSWKRPRIDPQMPNVLAEFGRGSPTGVMRYRHGRLPTRFQNGLFVLDWTFGRVLFVSDDGEIELVARPRGNAGFAVTDIDAYPDGRIAISVGGRRSRGGIYMIDAQAAKQDPFADASSWNSERTPPDRSPLRERIVELRSQPVRRVDPQAARVALNALINPNATRDEQVAATALLIESVGGLGAGNPKDARGKQQVAAVFDSYRSILRPQLGPDMLREATDTLISLIESNQDDLELKNELIRALAVMEPESARAFECVMADLHQVSSPTDKLHRLIALARLPVKRSDAMTEQIAAAMLQIPRQVEQAESKVDRNWTPRLAELFVAMEHRDSLLPSRLVATSDFGQTADLVWTERMDPENLERARQKLLSNAWDDSVDPRIARFIARGDDAVPPVVIRQWLEDPVTRPAGWLAIASHARASDIDELRKAALSVDVEAREAAVAALKRLGEEIPTRVTDSQSIQRWLSQAESLTQQEADATRGKTWFQQRQCALCHNNAKAIGPSLEGISKRFGTEDLFRSTVDPNHTISDRYRAKQVLTVDGQVFIGMPIYESVDGVTLMTADAKTARINAEEIAKIQESPVSLMPEGLIDGMSLQQVADLLAYLRSL